VCAAQLRHCGQIAYGDWPRQGNETRTERFDSVILPLLVESVIELLSENLPELLALWAKIIEGSYQLASGVAQCVLLHPRVAARQVVEVIEPSFWCITPEGSYVGNGFVSGEPKHFNWSVMAR
jgi:hypothetical protein